MTARRLLAIGVLGALLSLPCVAYAAEGSGVAAQGAPAAGQQTASPNSAHGLVTPTYVPPGVKNGVYTAPPAAEGSKGTNATYNLDWTIGSAGKSGCLVCHGNKNLVRIAGGKISGIFTNTLVIEASAHGKHLCTDCHTDFAFKAPHDNAADGQTWRVIAKTACKNCHTREFSEWSKSAHSTAESIGTTSTIGRASSTAPGKDKPLCGDCHDAHSIPSKKDKEGHARVRASALSMCGGCHAKPSATYNDYYHGSAYRSGAPDAPACWQCHNTHLVLPVDNRQSATNPDNLVNTCSKCHKGAGEGYVEYATLVHDQKAVYDENPVVAVVNSATSAIGDLFTNVLSVFRIRG